MSEEPLYREALIQAQTGTVEHSRDATLRVTFPRPHSNKRRTSNIHKCAAVPRRARIQGS